jgi:hypothetical protein
MRPLLISGLLCVPALVTLSFGWPYDGARHLPDVTVASPRTVSAITISLPPGSFQAELSEMDRNAWNLAWAAGLTAAQAPPEPLSTSPKKVRIARARTSARSAGPVVVAQATFQERPVTVWARVLHWLTQHEAPQIWSTGGADGPG